MADELRGGRITAVQRSGNAVVRAMSPNRSFVHRLLVYFGDHGLNGAPRLLGTEGADEILTFVEGDVPWQEPIPGWAVTDHALRALTRLVRTMHDITAGTALAGGAEVVCHHDLSPSNTVYSDVNGVPTPTAFVDWDVAGPGRRIEDIAHVCWQWLDLGPRITDVAEAAWRIAVICDAYDLRDRPQLLPTIVWWQDRCRRGIESGAESGDPALRRLVHDGIGEGVRVAQEWTMQHSEVLAACLIGP